MKQFALGSAFLMLVASLPADATKEHSHTEPPLSAQKAVFMTSFGNTLPPVGYVSFCQEHEAECRPTKPYADRVPLTPQKRRELDQVNRYVNQTVAPTTDLDLYGKVEVWTYPAAGKGDCEDYVLLKRRMLLERGWPESTLLITVVRDENNEGHAVLTARTSAGDLVLDNKRQEIVRWTATPYTFVKQQSDRNPLVWTSLLPPDQAGQTTVSASHSY
jgi:predicted transglutaminase-like cysteine proteinase